MCCQFASREFSQGMFAKVCDCLRKPWMDMVIFTNENPKVNHTFILGIHFPE